MNKEQKKFEEVIKKRKQRRKRMAAKRQQHSGVAFIKKPKFVYKEVTPWYRKLWLWGRKFFSKK